MRIAIAGNTYYPGNNGQAIFTIHLAEGLVRAGHEVHVIVPSTHFRYEQETINGVHVHEVRSINLSWIHPEVFLNIFSAGQISRIFKKHRPDVVHIQDHYFVSRDVAYVARRMHIPLMGTNHFLPENVMPYLRWVPLPRRLTIRIMWGLMLWTYNHLDIVTTPTTTAAKILMGQKIRPAVTPVSCGVDTHYFHPEQTDRAEACKRLGIDASKILCLYVGRLDGEKRIDLLLRGLNYLRQQGRDDLQLVIAGQGAAGGELRTLAHTLNLGESVRFLGYVPNEVLPVLYQTADIFGMPSPEELQSIATLEAMASGRPILAANARALPELVAHQVNGYLFEPGQVDDVACGLAYLADHRADWPRMGEASRARAVAHSLDNTISRYEEVYRRIAGPVLERSGEAMGVNKVKAKTF